MAVADLVAQGYGGYAGWDDAAADADFKATGGKGKMTGMPGQVDPVEQARKLNQFQVEANQPAIRSLQASIPETQAKFQTERSRLTGEIDPLKQRYQSILQDLTRRETGAVNQQTKVTANEYGRRGIPLSSNMAEQGIFDAVNPIRSEYATLSRDTGLAQEDSLRNIQNAISALVPQETEATRAIQNAIAALQSGNPVASIQSALSYIAQQQQAAQSAAQMALQREQLNASNAAQQAQQALQQQQFGLQQRQFGEIDLPTALANIRNINSLIGNRISGGGSNLPSLDTFF